MATVFLAQERKPHLHRWVAIKVLRPELATAVGVERFVREIAIAAELAHPHIVPLLTAGEADGLLYYVMHCLGDITATNHSAREADQYSPNRATREQTSASTQQRQVGTLAGV